MDVVKVKMMQNMTRYFTWILGWYRNNQRKHKPHTALLFIAPSMDDMELLQSVRKNIMMDVVKVQHGGNMLGT